MTRTLVNPDSVLDTAQYGYSQACIAAGSRRVVVSGQAATDVHGRVVDIGLQGQTAAALANVERVLVAAGGRMEQLVMLRIYACETVREDLGQVSEELRRRFPANPPPSSWIVVSSLAMPEWLILIEAEAVLE
ncbi:RidA family protein [Achromobacter pestifer]|uniref:RidA family protein n=1 Tax=Achromobacter pestifer TaxID=1353889 RepID=A0A7D4HSW1_9BURK|nr:RidA family protein [Achromobacter pestifer]QKH37497.1 RidA family protein [Achromobacter pestifer]